VADNGNVIKEGQSRANQQRPIDSTEPSGWAPQRDIQPMTEPYIFASSYRRDLEQVGEQDCKRRRTEIIDRHDATILRSRAHSGRIEFSKSTTDNEKIRR
jgi:thymidylate kinase